MVTIFTGWNFINSTGWVEQHYAPQNVDARLHVLALRDGRHAADGSVGGGAAEQRAGFHRPRTALGEWLSQNVEKTAQSYWGNSIVSSMLGPLGAQGLEPYATWRKLPGETPIKPFANPKGIHAGCWSAGRRRAFGLRLISCRRKSASIDAWR